MNKEQKLRYKEAFIKYLFENRPTLSEEEFQAQLVNQKDWNSGKNIYPADFSYKNLTGCDFKNMNLQDAVFIGAIIDDCDFTGAVLDNAKFNTFSSSKLERMGIDIEKVITYEKYLAALENDPVITSISDYEIKRQLDIHEDKNNPDVADFSYKDLTNKNFKNLNLSCANFKGAILDNCDFTGSCLDGANFSHLTKPELKELGIDNKDIYSYEYLITDDYLDRDYMAVINKLNATDQLDDNSISPGIKDKVDKNDNLSEKKTVKINRMR